jgi:phage gp16-like protein
MNTARDPLTSLRARIHIAKKQMGRNDEEYRALLLGVTGKDSTSLMDRKEMERVLMEYVRLGWRPAPPAAVAPATPAAAPASRWMQRPSNWGNPDKNPMYRKLYALICAHKEQGWSWGYVRGTAKKMFEAQKGEVVLEWLAGDELHSLVSALQIASNRLRTPR